LAKIFLTLGWCICVSAFSVVRSNAQTYPNYYQFFSNPYFYNPSFAGSNDFTELNLIYRKQWSGLEDAPELNAFSIQHPTEKNISLGFNFYTEKSVVLRSSAGFLTFAYKVRFTEESYLKFGISGGLGVSNLDLDAIANSGTDISTDPALANAIGTTYAIKGNFGVHYRFKNFTLGFSLPNLFRSNENDSVAVNDVKFSQLDDQIYTLGYKAPIGTQFSIEPYVLYRRITDIQDQKEASLLVHYKDVFWIGGGYRIDYGPVMTGGIHIKDMLRIGYSYEIATSQDALSSYGSHEVQLRLRLGKHRPSKATTKVKSTPVREEQQEEEEALAPVQDEIPSVKEEPVEAVASPSEEEQKVEIVPDEEPANAEKVAPVQTIPKKLTEVGQMAPGIYVVVGAFKSHENASKYNNDVVKLGYPSKIGLGKKGLYYVYVYSSIYLESSRKMRDQIREIRDLDFRKAWILEVE